MRGYMCMHMHNMHMCMHMSCSISRALRQVCPPACSTISSERSIRTMSTPLRLACVALVLAAASGCTNFIVTKGACEEGVNMISYTDDGGNNYGELRLTQP